jgi:hypothetical protein
MNCNLCDNKNLLRFITHCRRCKILYCFECQKKIENEKSGQQNAKSNNNNDTIINVISCDKSKIPQHSIYIDQKEIANETSLLQKLPIKSKTECCETTVCEKCDFTSEICKYCTEKMCSLCKTNCIHCKKILCLDCKKINSTYKYCKKKIIIVKIFFINILI